MQTDEDRQKNSAGKLPQIIVPGGNPGTGDVITTEILDVDGLSWSRGPQLSVPRSGMAATALSDGCLVAGGRNGATYHRSCDFLPFGPDSTVRSVAAMRTPRNLCSLVSTLDGKAIVLGGWSSSSDRDAVDIVEQYDPIENRWVDLAPMSSRRGGLSASVIDGVIYVAGGFDSASQIGSAEMFDFRVGRWTSLPPMAHRRSGPSGSSLPSFSSSSSPSFAVFGG